MEPKIQEHQTDIFFGVPIPMAVFVKKNQEVTFCCASEELCSIFSCTSEDVGTSFDKDSYKIIEFLKKNDCRLSQELFYLDLVSKKIPVLMDSHEKKVSDTLSYIYLKFETITESNNIITLNDRIKTLKKAFKSYSIFLKYENDALSALYFTKGLNNITGHRLDEFETIAKHNFFDLICSKDQERIKTYFNKYSRVKKIDFQREINLVFRIVHKDVYPIWIKFQFRLLKEYNDLYIYATYNELAHDIIQEIEILDNSPNSILVIETETNNILYYNKTFRNLFPEYKNHLLCDDENIEKIDLSMDYLSEDFSDKEYIEQEINGRIFHIKKRHINWNGLFSEICYFIDVTETITTIQDIKNLQDKLSFVLSRSKIILFEYDLNKDILIINNFFSSEYKIPGTIENFTKYLATEELVKQADLKDFIYHIEKLKKNEISSCVLEYKIKMHDNLYTWRRIEISKHNEKNKNVALGIMFDTDQYKNLELRFNQVLQQNGIDCWVYNLQTNELEFINSNRYKKGTVFYDYDQFVISNNFIHYEDKEKFLGMIEAAKGGQEVIAEVLRYKVEKNSGWHYLKIDAITTYDELTNAPKMIGSAVDVTGDFIERQKYEEAINLFKSARNNYDVSYMADVSEGTLIDRVGIGKTLNNEEFFKLKYMDALKLFASLCLREEDKQWLIEHTPENILSAYSRGIVEDTKRIQYAGNLKIEWLDIYFKYLKNPINSHIVVLVNCDNVTYDVHLSQFISNIISTEFDCALMVNFKTEDFVLSLKQGFNLTSPNNIKGNHFFEKLNNNEIFTSFDFNEYFNIDDILSDLATNKVFEENFVVEKEDDKRVKKLRATYINEEEKLISITLSDITKTIKTEEKEKQLLEQALKETKSANSAKSDFLAHMSHDMRTPLNAIIGLSELILSETNIKSHKEYLENISNSGLYLLGIINDILNLTKLSQNKIIKEESVCNLTDLVNRIKQIVTPFLQQKSVNLEINVEEVTDICFKLDVIHFTQIFVNIINNSIKYSDYNSKIIWNIRFVENDGKCFIESSVVDFGFGMSKSFQQKMFEPFTRENNNLTSPSEGTGLGLSIVKNLITLLNGTIKCTSKIGFGTTFEITIPTCLVGNISNFEAENIIVYDRNNNSSHTILVCEDMDINAKIVTKILEKENFKVDRSINGLDCIKKVSEKDYSLILMDIRMPIMDGIEATRQIRKFNKILPIIALSANAYPEDIKKSYDVGMNEHLSKPIKFEKLLDTIYKYIK